MDTVQGANFSIYYDSKPVLPQDDGFIGTCENFKPRTALKLVITLPPNCSIYEKKPKTEELKQLKVEEDAEGKFYSRKFVFFEDLVNEGMGWLYPRIQRNNSNRLKVVVQENGRFKIYEVGFCNQDEKLFFRIQLIRDKQGAFNLEAPKTEPDTYCDHRLPNNVGKILWYNDLSGIMAVRTKTGTARGHWSEILNCKYRFVRPDTGFIVFGALTTPTDTQTRFLNEVATGIALVEEVPTSGGIILLVNHITSADQVDDGFRTLQEILGH